MKTVNFIISPFSSGHAIRGVGFYTKRLLDQLKVQAPKFDIKIVEDAEVNCDLVHYPFFDLFQCTLPMFRDTKTVVTIHDVIPLEFPKAYPPGVRGWLYLQHQKLALSGVERVITDSHASVKAIHKYLGVPHDKLKLIYLAADEKFKKIKNPKNKFNLPDEFVLYVGDVNYNKNIPNLVKACRKINSPLVIVGKQVTQIDKLDLNHAELRHLQGINLSKVIKLGFVPDEDLVHIYNLATVYCQPSFSEGFGLPVVEALACGTPVACSNASSLPEIAGDNATYFNPYGVDDMSRAIINAKPPQSKPRFSWEETAKSTLMVYREI